MSLLRLLVLSAGVLGVAWYSLSGGADFKAGSHGITIFAAAPLNAPSGRIDESMSASNRVEMDQGQSVARLETGTSLTSVASAGATKARFVPAKTSLDAENKKQLAALFETSEPVWTLENAPQAPDIKSAFDKDPLPFIVPAASFDLLSSAKIELAAPVAEYRVVTGSRVNLRQGPGTNHDVVAKLTRGAEVEVLDQTEAGWVKLRSLQGSSIGWMSANFLASAD